MKRTLTALSLAALASTAFAAVEVVTSPELDRIPPTVEQILADAYRQNAGEGDADNVVKTYADAYRVNAGESDQDAVVRTPVADAYRQNAGEGEADNVVKTYVG